MVAKLVRLQTSLVVARAKCVPNPAQITQTEPKYYVRRGGTTYNATPDDVAAIVGRANVSARSRSV